MASLAMLAQLAAEQPEVETIPLGEVRHALEAEPDWQTKKKLIRRRQKRLVDLLDDMGKLPSTTQTTITEDGETTSEEKLTPDFRMSPKPGVHGSYSPGLKNSILWEQESVTNKWPHFYDETMPHEVAHAGAALTNDMEGQGHGKEWEELMRDLQIGLRGPDEERIRELDAQRQQREIERQAMMMADGD